MSNRCILTTVDPDTGERRRDLEPLATMKTFRFQNALIKVSQHFTSMNDTRGLFYRPNDLYCPCLSLA